MYVKSPCLDAITLAMTFKEGNNRIIDRLAGVLLSLQVYIRSTYTCSIYVGVLYAII